ncbi:hypothetical protein [Caudoviricetes sp.]|nr:hypothetical protein [Caudoviricetes sp.]
MQAYVRVQGEEYDVKIEGLSKRSVMVLREIFSDVSSNTTWATTQPERDDIISAFRHNSVMVGLHDEFKRTYRDVAGLTGDVPVATDDEGWQG